VSLYQCVSVTVSLPAGMGLVISQELALAGADVIMACRSEQRGLEALEKVEGVLETEKDKRGYSPGVCQLGAARPRQPGLRQ